MPLTTMPDPKKEAIARAAKHVTEQADIEITEIIPVSEDNNLQLRERIVAAVAMFFGSSVTLAIILLLLFWATGGLRFGVLVAIAGGWKYMAGTIGILSACAFIRPAWTFRVFGYLMEPFHELARIMGL